MALESLIERVRQRLAGAGYASEAAVSTGVVLPVLAALGWDTTDPDEVIPEFANERGRVDYALCVAGRRPAVFVAVKGVGRSLDGDRQLFEYAFHTGVPLCLLTDGREWAVYLPSGQGDYNERRVYRLQLDERSPSEAASRLQRYLARDRVRNGDAQEAARLDHRDVAARREAERELPQAWSDVVATADEVLIDLIAEAAEQRCGFRPSTDSVATFLRSLAPVGAPNAQASRARRTEDTRGDKTRGPSPATDRASEVDDKRYSLRESGGKISYYWRGEELTAATAKAATVDLLRRLVRLHPERMQSLAARVQSRKRAPFARSPEEINPGRPDLANAYELVDGWLVGMHTSNREKTKLLRAACEVMGETWGESIRIDLPNG